MPAWATVTITLGAALIGVLGTLAAARMQLRHASREREAAAEARWREEGAKVATPLLSLIEDAEPLRLGMDMDSWHERWLELWERWALVRDQLAVFAASHPSDEIGKTVAEITKALPQSLANTGWFLGSFVGPQGRADGYDQARAGAESSHVLAQELAQTLLAQVREFAGAGT